MRSFSRSFRGTPLSTSADAAVMASLQELMDGLLGHGEGASGASSSACASTSSAFIASVSLDRKSVV